MYRRFTPKTLLLSQVKAFYLGLIWERIEPNSEKSINILIDFNGNRGNWGETENNSAN